ncbi:uncharacterized protein L3040_003529 [Drepanopeziza brunnea f. sp. 'multigermtubi']|nr:hypothetical protein L3040_003529 [Drepanopeziza brunnea f. sp. 'multigermtubi']
MDVDNDAPRSAPPSPKAAADNKNEKDAEMLASMVSAISLDPTSSKAQSSSFGMNADSYPLFKQMLCLMQAIEAEVESGRENKDGSRLAQFKRVMSPLLPAAEVVIDEDRWGLVVSMFIKILEEDLATYEQDIGAGLDVMDEGS